MADESPDAPTVWKDAQHEDQPEQIATREEGGAREGRPGKPLPTDADTAGTLGEMAPEAAAGLDEPQE